MTQTATDYLEAIDHIPVGGKLYLEDVGWDDYEELLEALEGKRHVRISYDNGRMEIMTLSPEHEGYASLFSHLVDVLAEELDLEFFSIRSTTLKRKRARQGKEPDDCFYIGDVARIVGKKRLDLDYDAPPDLAIEVDVTNPTLDKMAIYAGLGITEVWRYDNYRVEFYSLAGNRYEQVTNSLIFGFLTPLVVADHLKIGVTQGIRAMKRAFREWVRANKP